MRSTRTRLEVWCAQDWGTTHGTAAALPCTIDGAMHEARVLHRKDGRAYAVLDRTVPGKIVVRGIANAGGWQWPRHCANCPLEYASWPQGPRDVLGCPHCKGAAWRPKG